MTSLQGSQTSLPESVELIPTSSEAGSACVSFTSNTSSKADLDKEVACDERPTNWRAVLTVSAIGFVTFLVMYTCNVSAFIYLKKIDKTTTAKDQGDQKVSARLFHGIATAVLAALSYNTKKFRPSVQIGNVMLIVSCILYATIEALPESWRKYNWLVVFALQAAAEGANTVLNAYIPRVSSKEDRMKAYSFLAGAEVVAVCLAPFVQLAANNIVTTEQPVLGVEWLKLSEFTLTIWVCGVLAVLNQILISFLMQEPPASNNLTPFKESWKQAWSEIKRTDLRLLIVCIVVKCVASFGCTTILTLAPPFIEATINKDESGQNDYTTIFQAAAGFFALATAIVFASSKTVSRFNSTNVFLFSLVLFFLAYFNSIPIFDALSHQVIPADAANPFGCDTTEYPWCKDYMIVDYWAWLVGTGCLFGIGFVSANISHDTIYSQVLGGIDQNMMTGLLIMAVDVSMLFVPKIATAVFTNVGPTNWWMTVVIAMSCGIVLWVCNMRRMEEYKKEVIERDALREMTRSDTQDTTTDIESGNFPSNKDANKLIMN